MVFEVEWLFWGMQVSVGGLERAQVEVKAKLEVLEELTPAHAIGNELTPGGSELTPAAAQQLLMDELSEARELLELQRGELESSRHREEEEVVAAAVVASSPSASSSSSPLSPSAPASATLVALAMKAAVGWK